MQRYYHTDESRNYSHVGNPKSDTLIGEFTVILDETAVRDLLAEIQQRTGDRDYSGFCGHRRPTAVIGQRMPEYTPQRALIWMDASTRVDA